MELITKTSDGSLFENHREAAYILNWKCPYYGDIELIGIYTTTETLEKAKEIRTRCSRIDDYAKHFEIEEIELNKLPWDCDND